MRILKVPEVFLKYYKVCKNGSIYSLKRTFLDKNGRQFRVKRKLLKPKKTVSGYLYVTLCNQGVQTNFFIHRLVAYVHLPNPENKAEVNHKNGNKHDNRASKLAWTTPSENQKHSFDILKRRRPPGRAIYQIQDGVIIREWSSARLAASTLKFKQSNIWFCLNGHQKTSMGFQWKYVNEEET